MSTPIKSQQCFVPKPTELGLAPDCHQTVMALPDPSEDACFVPSVFQCKDFKVDEFVSSCKKRVSTEHLHDDLKSYYTVLKAAMVELINKDYADFLDLSANLVSITTLKGCTIKYRCVY